MYEELHLSVSKTTQTADIFSAPWVYITLYQQDIIICIKSKWLLKDGESELSPDSASL